MLFSSPPFFFFFGVYFIFHLLVPLRYRLLLIIVGSTIFYGYWNPYYIWIPHALMLVAYIGARWVESARGTPRHFTRLALIVAVLLTPLAIVKYANFAYSDVLGPIMGWGGRLWEVALPLGISFITFTMISYVVDVYRGLYPIEMKLGRLAGLVLFFPHLIAGPILRPHDLLPQLARPRPAWRRLAVRLVFGLAIFSVGLLKKLVFADPVAGYVDAVYNAAPGTILTAPQYWLAIYGFSLQIYCDFSGYTDMAIGIAIMLGMRLPTNFVHPYTSASVAEFWRRWHITLSTWLRDYLYIPLGGNRASRGRRIANVMITMGLGGLWHGANWTFVLWGLLHGAAISFAHLFRRPPNGGGGGRYLPRWLLVVITFHFVTLCWIPFRASNLETTGRVMLGAILGPVGNLDAFAASHLFPLLLLAFFLLTHRWDSHRSIRRAVHFLPQPVFWPVVVLIWILAITVSAGSSAKFIYFDF